MADDPYGPRECPFCGAEHEFTQFTEHLRTDCPEAPREPMQEAR